MESLGERLHFGPMLWGHWVRMYFFGFSSAIEAPNVEIINLLLLEKLLALGERLKEKKNKGH